MSGTKASTQQRTSKKAADFILRQRSNGTGARDQGWNQACETLAAQIRAGAHLAPVPLIVPTTRAPGKSTDIGQVAPARLGKATATRTVLQPSQDGSVAPAPRCGKDGCIHQAGHVELGQPLHSDGERTWRDRK